MATEAPLSSDPAPVPRSRRAILAGAIGGVAGLVAGRLGRPDDAAAAAGSALIIGSEANNAGTKNTQLIANSNVVTFKLYQQGPGTALMGYTTPATGQTRGVYGRVDSPNGDGVQARNAGAAGTGAAVRAYGGLNDGVVATTDGPSSGAVLGQATSLTGNSWGVYGQSDAVDGAGVVGYSTSTDPAGYPVGVAGECESPKGTAVFGLSTATTGDGVGVLGAPGNPVDGWGVFSVGDMGTDSNLYVTGEISKGGGSFKIDHPLDPANKYLLHSFVESPDMLNVYNGNVELDRQGEATVELPDWFEALNRDFRYQLTAIGSSAPDLYIKAEINGNRFLVAGGTSGQKVSWLVTGIRQDAWANDHRIPVEAAKAGKDKGRYLHPKEHGKSEAKGIKPVTTPHVRAKVRQPE